LSISQYNEAGDSSLKDETLLLQELFLGNEKAYTTIYTHYQPRLYRYVLPFAFSHQMADEIVQDVLLKIWIRKEALIGIVSFEKYLIRMARNQLIDSYKKEKTKNRYLSRLAEPAADPLQVENEYAFKEYQEMAVEAINQLPEKRRAAFQLWSNGGMSMDEIADTLNISKAGVQKHLIRSAHFIKAYLRKRGEWVVLIITLTINRLN